MTDYAEVMRELEDWIGLRSIMSRDDPAYAQVCETIETLRAILSDDE